MEEILFYRYIPVVELNKEVYLEPRKTIKMDCFIKKSLTSIFAKRSILDIWKSSERFFWIQKYNNSRPSIIVFRPK